MKKILEQAAEAVQDAHKKKKSEIHIKPSHKGMLHEDTGTPEGEPIPASKIQAAKNSSDPAVRKRAVFAQNAKKWNHG